MKLLKLQLSNFQGVKSFTLVTNGLNVSVYGDNGSGKTTLFNAFTWLLYGKASTGEKGYTPQTTGTHHLDHSAEMTLELGNGAVTQITLKKVYHEVYKTQRGSADAVFSGFTTDYYIDGVPVKEKEYNARLTEIYESEERAKQLTRPFYFLEEMKIQDRRNLLLDVCGDIEDADVIAKFSELGALSDILEGKDIESYLKIAGAKKKEIDKELKAIPQRIDEAEKAKPEITVNKEALETDLTGLEQEKAALESRLNSLDATVETELKKQISDLELEKVEAAKAYAIEHENDGKENREKIRKLEEEKTALERSLRLKKESIEERKKAVECHEKKRQDLLDEYGEVAAKEWSGDTICPTCGQPLPSEKIEESKKVFNAHKSEKLERINTEGKKVSLTVIEQEREEIDGIVAECEMINKDIAALDAKIEDAKAIEARESTPDFSITAKAAEFDANIKVLKDRLAELKNGSDGEKDQLKNHIAEVGKNVDEVKKQLLSFDLIEKQNERIRELGTSEKTLAAEYEKIEHGIYLCELFTRRKAELLTDKINARFKTLKFRLFIEQINGGIADDCEAIIPCEAGDVPFKSANNAARINAGLEVIDTLGEYYGLSMPIYIDNAESNAHISATKAQQIRLYVSENDKELRIEEV